MNLNKRAFQIIQDEGPKFNPADFEPIGYDLIKDLRDFYVQAFGARWEEGFATAVRLMRRHDGGSALRELYEISREAMRQKLLTDIRDATTPTFKGVIHTVELFNGPWWFDSMGGRTIHSVRMWYTKEFMKDIVIKINLYPWIPEIPVLPIEFTGYHTNPKMYSKAETNKWFIKNTVNK